MSKSQRNKGAAFEREVAAELTKVLGYEVKRQLGQARDGGHDIDLQNGILVECKRRKSFATLYDWMAQCVAACAMRNATALPMLVVRADGEESLVVVRLADLGVFTRKFGLEQLL